MVNRDGGLAPEHPGNPRKTGHMVNFTNRLIPAAHRASGRARDDSLLSVSGSVYPIYPSTSWLPFGTMAPANTTGRAGRSSDATTDTARINATTPSDTSVSIL